VILEAELAMEGVLAGSASLPGILRAMKVFVKKLLVKHSSNITSFSDLGIN
jgi:hypothetical protein